MKASVFSPFWIAGILSLAAFPSYAQPTAIVEAVEGDGVTVQEMELLEQGAVIELPEGTSVVLGYLASCLRERIEGGKTVVGTDQSLVTGGTVTRETVQCQSASVVPAGQSGEGGALIFRGGPDKPEFPPKIRDLSPAFLVDGATGGPLVIERIDREEAPRELPGPGPLFDSLGQVPPLSRGGHYRVRIGDRETEFRIDRYSARETIPPLERLVRF
jgi:hypothetical protein